MSKSHKTTVGGMSAAELDRRLGETFRQAREKRKLSVQDLAAKSSGVMAKAAFV